MASNRRPDPLEIALRLPAPSRFRCPQPPFQTSPRYNRLRKISMRALRPILIALLLIVGFYALTSRSIGSPAAHYLRGVLADAHRAAGNVPLPHFSFTEAEAAPAYDPKSSRTSPSTKKACPP